MEDLCASISELLSSSNSLLQDYLRQTTISNDDADISDKIIQLIAMISRLSLQSNKLRQSLDSREVKTVSCLRELRTLVRLQQDEIRRLRIKPATVSVAVESDMLSNEISELKKVKMKCSTISFFM